MLPADQLDELAALYFGAAVAQEGGVTFVLLPNLMLPERCTPLSTDALLCPSKRDGYESRLFFSKLITGGPALNWNANAVRILERTWWAFSLTTPAGLRLAQMVSVYLAALNGRI